MVVFDQTFPSVEYMTFALVPLFATAKNFPFPYVTADHVSGWTTAEVVQFRPSVEYAAPRLVDVATKSPFPEVTEVHVLCWYNVQVYPSRDINGTV